MDEKFAAVATRNNSDTDTLCTMGHFERNREQVRLSNPQGLTQPETGVDVEKAEQEFSELNRELSNISYQNRHLSKQVSRASKPAAASRDLEQAASEDDTEQQWDLEDTLRGIKDAESEAGIRDKHIGE